MTLILSVAAGVGLFLVVAFLRMLLGIALPKLLVVFYGSSLCWPPLCQRNSFPWPLIPAA